MKRAGVALVVAAAVIAACAGHEQSATYRELDRMGANYERSGTSPLAARDDSCHLAEHQDMIGREQSAIQLPEGARVICFNCAVTQDFVATRLNVQLGADGKVASLRCG